MAAPYGDRTNTDTHARRARRLPSIDVEDLSREPPRPSEVARRHPVNGALASVTCYSQGGHTRGAGTACRHGASDATMEATAPSSRKGQAARRPERGTWTRGDQEQGPLACYLSTDGNTIMWGSDDTGGRLRVRLVHEPVDSTSGGQPLGHS